MIQSLRNRRVFISYRFEEQQDWVCTRLIPILRSSGVTVLIDRENFRVGYGPEQSAVDLQSTADHHILVISQSYFRDSSYCKNEAERALATDPTFEMGRVVPIRRDASVWPKPWGGLPNSPLYIDLSDGAGDEKDVGWQKLVESVSGRFSVSPTAWLFARDQIVDGLRRGSSINLVCSSNELMKAMVEHIMYPEAAELMVPGLLKIDLEAGAAETREGLLRKLCKVAGLPEKVSAETTALEDFENKLEILAEAGGPPPIIAFLHGGYMGDAERRARYGTDLFRSLRYCTQTERWLVLLFCSQAPINSLVPNSNHLSQINWQEVRIET